MQIRVMLDLRGVDLDHFRPHMVEQRAPRGSGGRESCRGRWMRPQTDLAVVLLAPESGRPATRLEAEETRSQGVRSSLAPRVVVERRHQRDGVRAPQRLVRGRDHGRGRKHSGGDLCRCRLRPSGSIQGRTYSELGVVDPTDFLLGYCSRWKGTGIQSTRPLSRHRRAFRLRSASYGRSPHRSF